MPESNDRDRIWDLLHGKSDLSAEDWAWVNRYLFLADKAFRDAKEADEAPSLEEQVDSILGKKAG